MFIIGYYKIFCCGNLLCSSSSSSSNLTSIYHRQTVSETPRVQGQATTAHPAAVASTKIRERVKTVPGQLSKNQWKEKVGYGGKK